MKIRKHNQSEIGKYTNHTQNTNNKTNTYKYTRAKVVIGKSGMFKGRGGGGGGEKGKRGRGKEWEKEERKRGVAERGLRMKHVTQTRH